MSRRLLALLVAGIIVQFSGCAYNLGNTSEPSFETLFIENFQSEVSEPALENLVTTSVIQEFQRDGTLRITRRENAEVVMRGVISGFNLSPQRYSRQNELTPIEASMSITVQYTLTRRGETRPFLIASETGTASFFVTSDIQSDKRQGVPIAAQNLGRNIVTRLVDTW
jgi:hypothetical protein